MKTRNYGIDFLRMISMIMIVMLHTLGHGGILRSVSFLSVHYQIAWLLEVIAFGAVNTYAMISGFVSVDSHFKISNILILWLQVLFYGILINTVFFFLLPESRNTSGWIQALFPVTRKEYWYFTAYAGVFFLSPFINQMFRNLSEKQIKTLFCFTLVVFSVVPTISQTFTPQQDVFYMGDGYSVFWLTLMYLPESVKKMIMLISPLSFGVYLLHDHPLVRSYVMTDRFAFITNGSVSKMLLFFFGIILAIFVVGCCVDAARSKLFQLLHIRKSLSKLDRYFDV